MLFSFTKMHGLGNDFVVIDNMDGKIKLSPEQVRFLCDRHFGVGADGVILVESSKEADSTDSPQADCFMNYYNSDGTAAEMCGNGARCVAKFLKENMLTGKREFIVDTRAGIKNIKLEGDGTFSVNMGRASFSGAGEIEGLSCNFVSAGNPHAVAFVEDLNKYDLPALGPLIENNPSFPDKINVEIVEEKSKNKFKVKVWERGSGETLACGTGAAAVYAAAREKGLTEGSAEIEVPGGTLFLNQNEKGEIIMRGPAEKVFEGEIEI